MLALSVDLIFQTLNLLLAPFARKTNSNTKFFLNNLKCKSCYPLLTSSVRKITYSKKLLGMKKIIKNFFFNYLCMLDLPSVCANNEQSNLHFHKSTF